MQRRQPTITDAVRSLMPAPTLNMLGRPLSESEARTVAERQAVKLLDLLGITGPSVEVELIAELPDIEVEVLPDLPLSGATDWAGDHWHVQINADDSLWRCRSTLAHEYKHILDDPFREELYPRWPRGSATPPNLAERICDYFAGCVLVPRQWLYKAWDEGMREPSILASHFDVSERLIEVRMDQTKVNARSGKHHWQRASRQAYHRSAGIVRNATRHLDDARKAATMTSQTAIGRLTKGEREDDYRDLCPSSAAV